MLIYDAPDLDTLECATPASRTQGCTTDLLFGPAAYLTLAVEKWKTMTGEQKKEYIEKHKPEFEGVELQHEPSSRQFYLRYVFSRL